MKNWKTSLFGAIAAGAEFVAQNPNMFAKWPWLVSISHFVAAGGLLGIGLASKDSTTHSTAAEVTVATAEKQVADVKAINN